MLCVGRHSGCRGVIEFRCAEVARQTAPAAAAAAALATESVTVTAAVATTSPVYVVLVKKTRPASQEFIALNGDADQLQQRMQKEETLRQSVRRGQDQLQHRLRQAQQPQQGTSSSSGVHQQAQQLRAAARECWNFGAMRLQNNRRQQQRHQQQQKTQAAWRRQHQHQHR